ncbi:MAG: DNA recombination protein RmuC [Ruminococcaceae bacterium]|nr:DNA recombination protein RmuC [Oscillospiraceae bacterium]
MTDVLLIILIIAVLVLILINLFKKNPSQDGKMLEVTQNSLKVLGESISQNQKTAHDFQAEKFDNMDKHITEKQAEMNKAVLDSLSQMELRFKTFEQSNEQKLENMRDTMRKSLLNIQEENAKKLEDMRKTVDEKLQQTLETKMNESFKMVSDRLEQVYKGLGEMQSLAVGVGDLKKVLSNVKTRGILGEIQLGAILKEILAPEQFEENVPTVPGSSNRVEFAIKMPNESTENGFVYLPIDSKFPADAYTDLQAAYESGNSELIKSASSTLSTRVKSFAKDIRDKYIEAPHTTDFAVMFLPFEGLYAEIINNPGLVETLQKDYKVNVAGPSTMAALLNSLQMGFKTLAIQKRSVEVWNVLSAVKGEFDKFGDVLAATQNRLDQANKELDKLVGVRTRAIQRKLKNIETMENSASSEDFLEE